MRSAPFRQESRQTPVFNSKKAKLGMLMLAQRTMNTYK